MFDTAVLHPALKFTADLENGPAKKKKNPNFEFNYPPNNCINWLVINYCTLSIIPSRP